jgi:hypothetical protein
MLHVWFEQCQVNALPNLKYTIMHPTSNATSELLNLYSFVVSQATLKRTSITLGSLLAEQPIPISKVSATRILKPRLL